MVELSKDQAIKWNELKKRRPDFNVLCGKQPSNSVKEPYKRDQPNSITIRKPNYGSKVYTNEPINYKTKVMKEE
jgi:hypothetical protein